MTFPAEMLTALRTAGPSNPRLIWYGPGVERIELSGRVLDNWVAKSANFLVDFLDVECGDTLALDLPEHWRTVVLCLAGLSTGATVRLGPPEAGEAVIAVRPRYADHDGAVAALTLAGLAMRHDGELPPGVLDYNAEARGCADAFTAFDEPDASQPAITDGDRSATFDELAAAAGTAARTLRAAGTATTTGLAEVLATLAAGGCVTLVHDSRAGEISQIARAEGIPDPA